MEDNMNFIDDFSKNLSSILAKFNEEVVKLDKKIITLELRLKESLEDENFVIFNQQASSVEQISQTKGEDWNCGYGDNQTQQNCYSFISTNVDLEGKRILDIGCGHGDFKDFLDKREIKYIKYVGIDGSISTIQRGRRRYAGIDLRHMIWPVISIDEFADLSGRFDIVVCIGIIYNYPIPQAIKFLKVVYALMPDCIVFDWHNSQGGLSELLQEIKNEWTIKDLGSNNSRSFILIKKTKD